jgi:uncharacterized protein HemX
MAEERIVTTEAPTHTTVIHESGSRGGGAGWFIGIVLVLALIAGVYFFTQMSGSQTAKDNAVANAASDVGSAAKQVGSAAEKAGDAAQDAANK